MQTCLPGLRRGRTFPPQVSDGRPPYLGPRFKKEGGSGQSHAFGNFKAGAPAPSLHFTVWGAGPSAAVGRDCVRGVKPASSGPIKLQRGSRAAGVAGRPEPPCIPPTPHAELPTGRGALSVQLPPHPLPEVPLLGGPGPPVSAPPQDFCPLGLPGRNLGATRVHQNADLSRGKAARSQTFD